MTWEQAGEPVVLVHTEAGEVKAFYNVCSHRGAPVVTEPKGKRLRLTCKYHGWSYSLDGDLKAIRDPEDFRDLDFSCRAFQASAARPLVSLSSSILTPMRSACSIG